MSPHAPWHLLYGVYFQRAGGHVDLQIVITTPTSKSQVDIDEQGDKSSIDNKNELFAYL